MRFLPTQQIPEGYLLKIFTSLFFKKKVKHFLIKNHYKLECVYSHSHASYHHELEKNGKKLKSFQQNLEIVVCYCITINKIYNFSTALVYPRTIEDYIQLFFLN